MRGRYAPSPTGQLHLGNARTALLAWLEVRAHGGQFVMRIEDLDPNRSRTELEAEQLDDLRWLGLDWDEGPDVGGPHSPYRQSQRLDLYAAAATRLDVFECSCSRKEVREAASAPHGREPVYPGTCRKGRQRSASSVSLRWHTPPGIVRFEDALYGEIREDVRSDVGEFVLRRGDGVWAYQLAVVVDDEAMGITHVLRGADLLDSTARQILLQQRLGYRVPRYTHVPLITGPDGQKLNKRHGAPCLAKLREHGVEPRRVVALLAASAGLIDPQIQALSPAELIPRYHPSALSRRAARLDYPALFGSL